jgi:hypothetical protein
MSPENKPKDRQLRFNSVEAIASADMNMSWLSFGLFAGLVMGLKYYVWPEAVFGSKKAPGNFVCHNRLNNRSVFIKIHELVLNNV